MKRPCRAKCIGLTGPIASGKSFVGSLLSSMGVTVIDLDDLVKELYATDVVFHFLKKQGRGDLVDSLSLKIDYDRLRHHFFYDVSFRILLEDFIHPLVFQKAQEKIHALSSSYIVVIVPIIINAREKLSRWLQEFDFLVTLQSNKKTCEQRLLQRLPLSYDLLQVIQKIHQGQESLLLQLADTIIVNDQTTTKDLLFANVVLLKRLLDSRFS